MSRTKALSPEEVKRIRRTYEPRRRTLAMLAERLGVAPSTVYKAFHRLPPYHRPYTRKELPHGESHQD